MPGHASVEPWWGAATVWAVVNAVNLLQAAGFFSRVLTRNRAINHLLGHAIIALAIPSTVAMVALIRAGAGLRQWIGPGVFLAFISMMLVVDYVWPLEFRNPARHGVLVPYLLLFFGSILLMGLPMYRLNVKLWLVTVGTTVLLLVSMGLAMREGLA